MSESTQEHGPRRVRRSRQPASASGRHLATALLPVLACFLGGATEKWAEGIVLVFLGALLLIWPPRATLGRTINLLLTAFVLCAGLAFAPAGWFDLPVWRLALVNDFGLALSATLSPQPWVSASCIVSLLAGVCWLYYVGTQPLDGRSVRKQYRIFAGAVVLLAALSIVLYLAKISPSFWHNERGFGPFPNRNQTANLFGLAALVVVACGHDDLRQRKLRWIFWLAGLVVLIAALVLNFSRAGLLLLLAGTGLWIAMLIVQSRSANVVALGVSALLALGTAILLFGGATLERFNLRAPGGADISAEFRWLIFRDTSRLIAEAPWSGIGLGNFEPVFAFYRNASWAQTRSLHPESDWLWLWAEAGWPAVVIVLLAAAFLARRVFPLAEGTAPRLRLAGLVAALLFALHGLVDVAGHRVGTALAGLFLFRLALGRPGAASLRRWPVVVFRGLGLAILVLGAIWTTAAYRQIIVPGSLGATIQLRLATAANVARHHSETIRRATGGLVYAPLDWRLYFLRGLAKLGANRPPDETLSDFRRARFLEPLSIEVPYQEGLAWLQRRPRLAVTAWREALRRARGDRQELYGRMLTQAVLLNPEAKTMLAEASSAEPDLLLVYLERAHGEDFHSTLTRFLQRDPALTTLVPAERERFFQLWKERGDRTFMDNYLRAHPELLSAGWRGSAAERAARSDFRAAYELARQYGSRPVLPPVDPALSFEQAQRRMVTNPNDHLAVLAVYREQMKGGLTNDALITIRRATERPDALPYFHYLEAEAWAAAENWEAAWKAWLAYEESLNR